MSELSAEIKRLRVSRQWNQVEAAKQCGINPSLFSRLESDKITNPTLETLVKLANGFHVETETLSALLHEQERSLRVGFAHSIWASPIIPLVMDGPPIKGIKLTSYGEFQPAESFDYRPHWYGPNSKLYVGPRLAHSHPTVELPPGYSGWPLDVRQSPYTAADLDWLLKSEQLDCVVAAKHTFAAHDSVLLRCARIMDCVGGGSAVLVWRKSAKYNTAFRALGKQKVIILSELTDVLEKNSLVLPIFYGQGTSAEKTLDFFGSAITRFSKKPALLRDWDLVLRRLDESLEENGGILFIGWEPYISSVSQKYCKPEYKTLNRIHLSNQRPMPYVSFDIMFTRDNAKKWVKSDLIRQFLKQIELNIERLRSAIALQQIDADVIRQISYYLNIDRAKCMESLSRLDFGLFYYPEWIDSIAE